MTNQNIILTGFMGTGKTTVGRLLAAELGYVFVDTDKLIAQRAGKPVSVIFAEDGEAVFRDWEAQIATELAQERRLVIATGGGLMLSERNADTLQEHGVVFCLTAKPKEIVKRVKQSGHRPLLDVDDPQERVEALLAEREATYRRYPQMNTSGRAPQKVVKEIVKALAQGAEQEVVGGGEADA
ncbi:MAG: shikimate kinase [Anaerolineales bacterium]|nr:shikimate kinase [Anaerolineales bacterium]